LEKPPWVTNEPHWVNLCRKVHARASDFVSGRCDLFEVIEELLKLQTWLRLKDDPDFQVFASIYAEARHLPFGPERAYWAADALARKDVELRAIKEQWFDRAMQASMNLEVRFAWAVARRKELARLGIRGRR
jgi:hypothetical protein